MKTSIHSLHEKIHSSQALRFKHVVFALCFPALVIFITSISFLFYSCSKPSAPVQADLEQVRQLITDGYFAEAEEEARVLLDRFQKSETEENIILGDIKELLAKAMRENGKSRDPETMKLAKEAVALQTRLVGEKHESVASSLYELGFLYWKRGDNEEALDTIERALRIQEKVLGPSHPDVAISLITLGSLRFFGARDEEGAMEYLDRARLIQEQALEPDHLDVAWRYMQQACVQWGMAQYAEALSVFKQELKIRKKRQREGHPKIGTCHNHIGQMFWIKGDYASARRHMEKSLVIREKAHGSDHPNVAHTMYGLANLLSTMGDLDAARRQYERALEIYREKLGENHASTAWCAIDLGAVYFELGDTEKALEQYELVLSICSREGEELDSLKARALVGYGALIQRMGDIEKAEEIYQSASEFIENTFGPDHSLMIEILHNRAIILNGKRDYEGARALFEQVLSYYEADPDSHTQGMICTLLNISLCYSGLEDQVNALDRTLRAEQVARKSFCTTSRSMEERLALKYASIGTLALYLTVSNAAGVEEAHPGQLARAFDAVIRWRALCLDEMVSRVQATREAEDPRITELRKELRSAREQFSKIAVAGEEDKSEIQHRQLLEKAQGRKEKAERALAAASLSYRRELEQAQIGLAEVRQSLPENSALVAFFRYEEDIFRQGQNASSSNTDEESHLTRGLREKGGHFSYLAFILNNRDTSVRVINLGRADKVRDLVAQWRYELQRGKGAFGPAEHLEKSYRRAAVALRQKIWDPFASLLEGMDQIFIVPDGVLHLVSMDALPDDKGAYLVESGPIFHYLAAERELAEVKDKPVTGQGLLAMGNPAYGEKRREAASRKAGPDHTLDAQYESLYFTALPQSSKEVENIASLWNMLYASQKEEKASAVLLTDDAATEAGFKAEAPGKRVLHLATHGFFLNPGISSGSDRARDLNLLGIVPYEDPDIISPLGENPLLLSGLALARANLRQGSGSEREDGILTAEEIAGLDLSGVEWVMLSGCDTGLGSIQAGEGVFGLRRALQLGGARTVIMSLWPVEDRIARLWMEAFYTARLKEKKSIASAVRTASRAVLEQRREEGRNTHPFFWAPFVATGDWR